MVLYIVMKKVVFYMDYFVCANLLKMMHIFFVHQIKLKKTF